MTRANSMAFSFFMAIFPAIIALFTLLPYTPLYQMTVMVNGTAVEFQDLLRDNITEVMPGEAGNMLFSTIKGIATKPRTGLLSFGFFLTIWFASNGMLSLMRGMEKMLRLEKVRNLLHCAVINQQRAEQTLLRLEVVRQYAIVNS